MLVRSLLLLLPALALTGACASTPKPSTLPSDAGSARPDVAAACGQADFDADFLGLQAGSLVRLRPHVEDDVPPNWAPDMSFYVDKVTRVERLIGVDDAGCPGVYVEADAQVFFWRVRDLEKLDQMATPSRCGQNEWGAHYLGLEPGMQVEIQEGSDWFGDRNWVEEMTSYVGKTAKVVEQVGVDEAGCPGVSLDVDKETFFWRVRDLTPVSR